jgi:hypothetical protein
MTRSRRRIPAFFLLLALGCTLATPRVSHAQDTASADDTERARILFQEGNAAYRERNWQLAYEKFHEAFGLAPTYDLAGNLGDVELMLDKPRDAAEHLAYSLKNWPAGQAEARAKTAARLKEAKGFVATIKVTVNRDGAEVFVNGTSVGTSPISGELFVNPGAITVEAKAGGKSDKSTIALDKGGSRAVTLTIGEAPGGGGQDPNGDNGTGGGSGTTDGAVSKPLIYTGIGVAVVGLGVGIGFTLAASSKRSDRDELRDSLPGPSPCGSGTPFGAKCDEIDDLDSSAKRFQTIGVAGFIVGGAAAIATATYALWPRKKTSASRIQFHPSVSRNVGSLEITGSF